MSTVLAVTACGSARVDNLTAALVVRPVYFAYPDLSELGRREDALPAAQEAVDIRRRLAETRPDAFLPDLAGTLSNPGNRLSELGRREEAFQAVQEAVRTLLPFFERLPAVYARWMATMANRYVEFAEENGSEEGPELIGRVMGVLERLEGDGKGEEND